MSNSKWRDNYATLEDYYKAEYCKTYKILDTETLLPLPNSPEYPCYSFDPEELSIDPDADPEELTILENDLPSVKKIKKEKQRDEIKKCIKSFPYFCHKYVKIVHPLDGLVPFVLYNYQRRAVSEYAEHKYNMITKFRQAGLTTATSMWSLWKCMFNKGQIIMFLSKTDIEALTAANMVKNAIDYLPTWLKPEMGKDNDHNKEFLKTNSRIDFAGPNRARSRGLTYMILDEAAHIPDMHKHWKAIAPTLSTGGSCIALSTVNGMGNWFQETFYAAREKKSKFNFNIIELDFWENPDYNNPDWVAEQRSLLGEDGWKQEVLRSFMESGATFIDGQIIMEEATKIKQVFPIRILFPEWCNEKDKYYDEKGALWVWKEPIDGHEYILAVDGADGNGEIGDNSCFEVIDVSTQEQVAEFYSNKIPPHLFSPIINQVGIHYNMALVIIEFASTSGGSITTTLRDICEYENLYYNTNNKRSKNQPGIKTDKTLRPMILEVLQHGFIQRRIKINSPRLITELQTFRYNPTRKRAEADKGRHDDAVMALSIALYVRNCMIKDIPVGAETPKELKQTFQSEVYEQIKKEVLRGAPENWIEEDEDILEYGTDALMPTMININKKYKRIIDEFGFY